MSQNNDVTQTAKNKGYNISAFHGTKSSFNIFTPSKGGEFGGGIYASPRKESADMFGSFQNGNNPTNVIPVFLKINNPLKTNDRNIPRGKGIKKLKQLGYDGVIGEQPNGDIQYIVFEPNQIKSAQPITYDDNGNEIPIDERFNPSNNDFRF